MATRNVELATPDGGMPVYETAPDGPARGGIVVIHEAFGVTGHIERICDRLAAEGWRAVAPALFHRAGSPVFAYDSDFSEIRPVMATLTREGLSVDLGAAFDHLAAAGLAGRRCGIVGFCMGGTVALFAGTEHELGAAITFYGGGIREGRFGLPPLAELAPSLRTPWFGAYGDQDSSIPVDEVDELLAAAAKAPVETGLVRYPDAGHGFNCDARPAAYNPAAATDAWARTLAFLDAHVA